MTELVSRSAAAVGEAAAPVLFYSQTVSFERIWPEIKRHIGEMFDRTTYSNGPKVAQFEAAIREYTGARHAIAVSSGTDALIMLLRATGIGPGDEVVVPAFTFAASATSVALVGARPAFVDIEPETYNIDPVSAAAAVTDRTRAIMPVHLFCQMADMTAMAELATDRELLVLEDSAEAIGMRWDGRHAGLLGTGGVLSFFPTKTLGAFGDAGMILTDDEDVARAAYALRNHGRMFPGTDPGDGAAVSPGDARLPADLTRTVGLPAEVAALAGVAALA
ncbi:MAG TPA: aminotransferase class I/II-fold pyridoxal phosphate-dependent enzyme, partial [Micromonospora sp.]|nr:aminotransferase class I/II-fold pyridoxal phosphate-dependent enzyme [Micromonospora sp.]